MTTASEKFEFVYGKILIENTYVHSKMALYLVHIVSFTQKDMIWYVGGINGKFFWQCSFKIYQRF